VQWAQSRNLLGNPKPHSEAQSHEVTGRSRDGRGTVAGRSRDIMTLPGVAFQKPKSTSVIGNCIKAIPAFAKNITRNYSGEKCLMDTMEQSSGNHSDEHVHWICFRNLAIFY